MKKKMQLKDLIKKERKVWKINPIEKVKNSGKKYNRKNKKGEEVNEYETDY